MLQLSSGRAAARYLWTLKEFLGQKAAKLKLQLDPIPLQAIQTGWIQLQRCHSSSHLSVGKALNKVICQTIDAPGARQWVHTHSDMHMKQHCNGSFVSVLLQSFSFLMPSFFSLSLMIRMLSNMWLSCNFCQSPVAR